MRGQLPIPLEARARYRRALRQSIGSARIYRESVESGAPDRIERCALEAVSTPRGNYPFRTFKRKPVANTNAARHEISEGTSGRKRERKRGDGNGRGERKARRGRKGKKRWRCGGWLAGWLVVRCALGRGLYALSSVRRGSHGFQPGIFGADRHADR